jgi:CHAT domain-containing protein
MNGFCKFPWPIAVLLFVTVSPSATPQAPVPPALTAGQQKRLQERDRLQLAAAQLSLRGKHDEARAAANQIVAADREVFGTRQGQLAQALLFRADILAEAQDFAAARRDALEALDLLQKMHPEGHWRVLDARRMVARIERLAKADPQRLAQLARAEHDLADYVYQPASLPTFQLAEAIRLSERALELRKQLFGEKDPDYARALSRLAQLHRREHSSSPRAEYLLQRRNDLAQETLGEEHPEQATNLADLGFFYLAKGMEVKRRLLCERAATIYEKTLGEDDLDYVDRLTQLALLWQVRGDLTHVKPLLEKSLAIVRATRGELDRRYLRSLELLAHLYWDRRAYAQAEPLVTRYLDLNRQAHGENSAEYYRALNQLATLYKLRGTSVLAEPLAAQALKVEQAIRQDKARTLAQARRLRELARAKGLQGSEPIYKEALAVYKEAVGEKHAEYIATLQDLASHYRMAGDKRLAEELFFEVLARQKETAGTGRPAYLANLRNLGLWYQQQSDFKEAEPLFQEAVRSSQKELGEKHPNYGQALHDLAGLYQVMKSYEKAEPLLRRALDFARETAGEKDYSYANALFELAGNYQRMGQPTQADHLFLQFLDLCRDVPGQASLARSLYPITRANLARQIAWHLTHLADKAEPVLHDWLTLDEEALEESFGSQSESERIQHLSGQRRVLESYLGLALEAKPSPSDRIYRHILAWKGAAARPADDQLARDRPELRGLVTRLNQARTRLSQLAFAAPPPAQQKEWFAQLGRLRNERENLESELVRKSDAFRQHKQQAHLGSQDVARALPPETALVDFFEYTHTSPSQQKETLLFQVQRRLLACVVGRDGRLACVSLHQGDDIVSAVRWWREGSPQAQLNVSERLGRLLWKPLEPHLAGARTVLIAPDGALTQLPFAVLPGRQKDSYLLEDLSLGYVTSGRQLVETFTQAVGAGGHGLLVAGGIDYAADPGPASAVVAVAAEPPRLEPRQRAGFNFLPGTEVEARRCHELFHQEFPAEPATLLTRAAAQEGRFKTESGRHYRYLHLATHGFFESPRLIAAVRAGRPPLEAGPPVDFSGSRVTSAETPFLHCGIVLAGASRVSVPGDLRHEDGILTAEEVAGLDLRGTELVVLSACDTGLGVVEQGQGVLGLQRAFLSAGARALVASLWKVDDAATALLMEEFYANLWRKKLPKLEALRQAQLTVLRRPDRVLERRKELAPKLAKKNLAPNARPDPVPARPGGAPPTRSEPRLWAAFVLSGDVR